MSILKNLIGKTKIIQAPMAGVSTPKMTVSACQAGIIGSIGVGMMEPQAIRKAVEEIKEKTDKPFNVNLFIVDNLEGYNINNDKMKWLFDYYKLRQLELPNPKKFAPKFEDQFEVLLELKPPIASFAFGCLDEYQVKALHDRDIKVIGAATSLEEALKWESVKADACVIQGLEAGGHRCNFIDLDNPGLPLFKLLSTVKTHSHIPLIAAGGITSGYDIQNALSNGADYTQIGTAFLTVYECSIPKAYHHALLNANGDDTVLTKAFSGRLARGVRNTLIEYGKDKYTPPYPVQNAYTQPLRKDASSKDRSDDLSLWAGQGVGKIRECNTVELIERLYNEYKEVS